uniref:Protein kinase domain-containing protein n=1 Tax=Haemonchus placei TaxID=6290 RepID=A0A0N4W316_HAEPC
LLPTIVIFKTLHDWRFEFAAPVLQCEWCSPYRFFPQLTVAQVAVKLIKKSAIENKADLVRIRREIRIMSALHHPNIIQIFEVFENREKIILVMEYASGGELYDYVSRFGSLPESEARRIFRQITSAVLYCHKHQVAHRDLKLENILLDQDNNAKIADFGLSNYFGTKSLLTTFCGSPLYASPEIINGTPYKGPEVDCWSLGILLYTLVYGSMPFDGRDFNRMVRQIKRGAYYEPDTPSTASMLIRNMLRVNPERRADIFEIASHWWLNLEENMPVIQELPENQITDYTPLTERAETMVVQDLADETDVFMEFGHLSNETRKKIEEFRRRRKQAEEYNENSPVKPPKDGEQAAEMKSEDKSLRGVKELNKEKETDDPLERLRQIENRLGQQRKKSAAGASQVVEQKRQMSPEQPEDPKPARNEQGAASRAPSFVPVTNEPETLAPTPRTPMSAAMYRLEIDSLNMLMNQVLEQMEKGPVSLNLVARIKAHPMYDARPMVKELLESIIAAQPENVQRETSKLVQQRSQVGSDDDQAEAPPPPKTPVLAETLKEEDEADSEDEEDYTDSEMEELAEEVER